VLVESFRVGVIDRNRPRVRAPTDDRWATSQARQRVIGDRLLPRGPLGWRSRADLRFIAPDAGHAVETRVKRDDRTLGGFTGIHGQQRIDE
jgi:hypothetical protein